MKNTSWHPHQMFYVAPSGKTSKFRGVSRDGNRWRVSVTAWGERHNLGKYYSEETAARVYLRKLLQLSYTKELLDFPNYPMANQEYYKNGESLVYAPTTLEEERELFTRARTGDLSARDTIIKNHLLFVANKGRAITKGKVPDDEVISACNAALMQAVDDFDASQGKRFTNYLIPCIRGAVARLWRDRPGIEKEFAESDCVESAPSPADEFEAKENGDLLLEALHKARGKLSAKEQELLRQVYIEKLSFAEIARRSKDKVGRAAPQAAHRRIIEKLRGLMKDSNE